MASSKPILIAGGGIGGLTAALCLARKGFQTIVFEQAPTFDEIGAGLQISPNGSRVLHHLGLAAALRERAGVPSRIEFRRWRSGKVVSVQPLGEAVRAAYGFPYYHLHRGDLLRTLARAAQQDERIELLANASVRRVEQDATAVRVTVATDAGVSTCEGIALIGADGIHSTVRDALFGKTPPAFTGYVAWRALLDAGRLPVPVAQLPPTVWWGAGGHFVHYFVRGGALLNCVGVVKKAGWEIESWTEPGEQQELRADFGGWHSDVRTLIERMEPGSLYKWALFDREPLRSWGKGRVTLLGDACHPMLPLSGARCGLRHRRCRRAGGVLGERQRHRNRPAPLRGVAPPAHGAAATTSAAQRQDIPFIRSGGMAARTLLPSMSRRSSWTAYSATTP